MQVDNAGMLPFGETRGEAAQFGVFGRLHAWVQSILCAGVLHGFFSEYGGDRVGGDSYRVFRGYARCGPRIAVVGLLAFSFL